MTPGRGRLRAVVVGATNFDASYTAGRIPLPGETLLGAGYLSHGGKGANQAVALAKFGLDAALISRVGDDAVGQLLLDELREQGVSTAGVTIDPDLPSGLGFVWLAADGENTAVVAPGANAAVSEADVRAYFDTVSHVDVVVAQLEVSLTAVAAALELGRRRGAITVLNAAPFVEGAEGPLELADYVIVNEPEYTALTSALPAGRHSADRVTFVTLGAGGVEVHSGGQVARVSPVRVEAVLDATGAGDAFCAAVAAAIANGRSPHAAARIGVVAGGLATQVRGARVDDALAAAVRARSNERDD